MNMEGNIPLRSPSHDQDAESSIVTVVTTITTTNNNNSCSSDSSIHNVRAIPGTSSTTMWTDEKHRLYLDSLEASFVDQLNRWIDTRGGRFHDLLPSAPYMSRGGVSCNRFSHQFTVLQDGCWPKMGFERNESLVESTADSYAVSAGKQHGPSPRDQCRRRRLERDTARRVCHHQDSVSAALEVSDQNFLERDHGKTSGDVPTSKRLKCGGYHASRNDNVANVSACSEASYERREQAHHVSD